MLFHLLFLDEFLQEGLREFKAGYSPHSIPATFSTMQGILCASVSRAWYSRRVVNLIRRGGVALEIQISVPVVP